MELKVNEIQALAPIQFNYEDLKKGLTEKVSVYKNAVYTEETITIAKTDRASLNKLSTAINDEKKRIKNLLLEPYTDFEIKCKELIGIIEEAVTNVDTQIKGFESKEKDAKLQEIVTYFSETVGDFRDFIDFDSIFQKSWLNKTHDIKKVQEDINHIFTKTKQDLLIIDGQIKDEVVNKQVKNYYFENISDPSILGNSLQEGIKIIENSKKIDELNNLKQAPAVIIDSDISKTEIIQQLDFRVWVTSSQKKSLKEFLKSNNIKVGRVE